MTTANALCVKGDACSISPNNNRRQLTGASVIALAAFFGFALFSQANAAPAESSQGVELAAADQTMKSMATEGMAPNDMGSMLRPDNAPPQGVAGGVSPKQGAIMPLVQYMRMRMEGNRDGRNGVSTAEVLSKYPVAPVSMDVDMLMAGLMYGVTDDISVMGMVPYLWKSMDHVTRMGTEFTTKAEGFGDARLIGGYNIYKRGGHSIGLSAGVSFPTGSTDERDDTPAGKNQLLPYPMQNGSGTFDLLPGIAYTGKSDNWSWGSQVNGVIRLGENDDNYTLGNVYSASVWGARKWDDWLSSSARLIGEVVENIDGADPRLNPLLVSTADPNLRAGNFLSVALGLNFVVPSGPAQGMRLSVEGIIPVIQDLDGPQLERDYTILVGLKNRF